MLSVWCHCAHYILHPDWYYNLLKIQLIIYVLPWLVLTVILPIILTSLLFQCLDKKSVMATLDCSKKFTIILWKIKQLFLKRERLQTICIWSQFEEYFKNCLPWWPPILKRCIGCQPCTNRDLQMELEQWTDHRAQKAHQERPDKCHSGKFHPCKKQCTNGPPRFQSYTVEGSA